MRRPRGRSGSAPSTGTAGPDPALGSGESRGGLWLRGLAVWEFSLGVRDAFRTASRLDAALALLAFAGLMIELAVGRGPLLPSVALALVSSAPLVVRRR